MCFTRPISLIVMTLNIYRSLTDQTSGRCFGKKMVQSSIYYSLSLYVFLSLSLSLSPHLPPLSFSFSLSLFLYLPIYPPLSLFFLLSLSFSISLSTSLSSHLPPPPFSLSFPFSLVLSSLAPCPMFEPSSQPRSSILSRPTDNRGLCLHLFVVFFNQSPTGARLIDSSPTH